MRLARVAGGIVLIVLTAANVALAQQTLSPYSQAIPQSLRGPFVSDPAVVALLIARRPRAKDG